MDDDLRMDEKELAHLVAEKLVAEKLEAISYDEVEAELKRAEEAKEDELKFGKPKGVVEIFTLVALIVQLAQEAAKIWATTAELFAALNAKAASAKKIDKKKREKLLKLFMEELDG